MSKKFKGIKTFLKEITYNLDEPEKDGMIDIDVFDKIEILEIKEDIITFNVIRNLKFKPLAESYINVVFRTSIKTTDLMNKQQFIDSVKKGIAILNAAVYSKISITISNITNYSVLGPIITSPIYNTKEIEIE